MHSISQSILMQKEISKVDSIYFKNSKPLVETTAAIAPNTPREQTT